MRKRSGTSSGNSACRPFAGRQFGALARSTFAPASRFASGNISDQVVTKTLDGRDAAYLRLRVANEGQTLARDVRVSLLGVERWTDDEQWAAAELIGADFIWSNRAASETSRDLPHDSERPIDLLAILRPRELAEQGNVRAELQITTQPANRVDQLAPGSWRVKLEVSASNAPPKIFWVAFRFDGAWPADSADGQPRIWEAVSVDGPGNVPQAQPPTPQVIGPVQMLTDGQE
jgi:hypothetical protein